MINSDTITEIWMLKRKKVTRSLSWHQYSAARELFVTFGFTDNFLYVSYYLYPSQTNFQRLSNLLPGFGLVSTFNCLI